VEKGSFHGKDSTAGNRSRTAVGILRVVAPYVIFAAPWIFLSDWLLRDLKLDPETRMNWHLCELWAFVCFTAAPHQAEVFYWRERNCEADFILRSAKALVALEVKSGSSRQSHPGMAAFRKRYPKSRALLVGRGGIPLEEFLKVPVQQWLE